MFIFTCDCGREDFEEHRSGEGHHDLPALQLHGHVEHGKEAEQAQAEDPDDCANPGPDQPG